YTSDGNRGFAMNATTLPEIRNPDDLLRMPDGKYYELIDGRPVEKRMGAKSNKIVARLGGWLDQFCTAHGLGHVFSSTTGYRCFPNRPGRVRKPDVSVVRFGRLPNEEVPDGDIDIPPDLAVEVISPTDRYEKVEAKMADYRSAGIKLVWVISPGSRTALV